MITQKKKDEFEEFCSIHNSLKEASTRDELYKLFDTIDDKNLRLSYLYYLLETKGL